MRERTLMYITTQVMTDRAPENEFFKGAPESVKKMAADWSWLYGLYLSANGTTQFTDGVRATTRSVQGAVLSMREFCNGCESSVKQLTATPAFVTDYKDTMLDVRRRFKAPIVTLIAGLSVLPALRAGPGKLEKLRVATRNLVIFGGSASVLLYPELVMRVAPKVANSIDTVQVAVSSKISK